MYYNLGILYACVSTFEVSVFNFFFVVEVRYQKYLPSDKNTAPPQEYEKRKTRKFSP